MIKQMLDELELVSFVKTSGNKGLQIHIPLPKDAVSYEETALLTEAIAKTVENMEPTLFTTERMKVNRGESDADLTSSTADSLCHDCVKSYGRHPQRH